MHIKPQVFPSSGLIYARVCLECAFAGTRSKCTFCSLFCAPNILFYVLLRAQQCILRPQSPFVYPHVTLFFLFLTKYKLIGNNHSIAKNVLKSISSLLFKVFALRKDDYRLLIQGSTESTLDQVESLTYILFKKSLSLFRGGNLCVLGEFLNIASTFLFLFVFSPFLGHVTNFMVHFSFQAFLIINYYFILGRTLNMSSLLLSF